MLKRSIAVLFVCLLSFGSVSLAKGTAGVGNGKLKVKTAKLQETHKPSDQVRVIVELDDNPTIDYATKSGQAYHSLAKNKRENLESQAVQKQKTVKDSIKQKKIKAKYYQQFTTVVNGFSAKVEYKDVKTIQSLPDVKEVHIATEYKKPSVKPEMVYSKELVQAQQAWQDYGYKGEGMVVGIIDTGIDYDHKDMIIKETSKEKLTKDKVNKLVSDNSLPGKFYTDKVPYGYNYYDENTIVKDLGAGASMHGMHVSGTVAANGDENNGGVQGMAPEAQLLALKVFSNDQSVGSTYGDIYVKAIDDAIKLGADVLNMSLGSPSGFVDSSSPEQQAVKRAVDNGVLVSISSGNSALFGDGFQAPYATNPDYGVTGSPGVSNESVSVASFENSHIEVDSLQYSVSGQANKLAYESQGDIDPNGLSEKTYEFVDGGKGTVDDFNKVNAKGKFAIIQRGDIGFVDKALNAQKAGAAGVIIYNNVDGLINMATDPSIKVPYLFMQKADGEKLISALQAGKDVNITFTGEKQAIDNPDAGKMSTFSSWGLTSNLDFKPEITAPGGQIYSTLNDNKYGIMSGTSMAAPHVAGGSALVLERVDKDFGLKNADRVQLAKNLLLNTSKQVIFKGNPVSPRREGAGLMQVHAALATPVIVTNEKTNEAKVALKEISNRQVTFTLEAQNLKDKDVSYQLSANTETDTLVKDGQTSAVDPNNVGATPLNNVATFTSKGKIVNKITVPAKGTTTFQVTLDLKKADKQVEKAFKNGYWLDGFVHLTDPTDNQPQLSVPFTGFRGDWNDAPIFDAPVWDNSTFYGTTGVLSEFDGGYDYLGFDEATNTIDPKTIAISPNGDGVQDTAIPIVSLLRNAKDFSVNILDKHKKVVRTINTEEEMYKDNYDSGNSSYYTLDGNNLWDGKVNGKVKDGQYYIQLKGSIDYNHAKAQSLVLPVKVDTTKPELHVTYKKNKSELDVKTADKHQGSGVAYWDILVNGKSTTNGAHLSSKDKKYKLTNDILKEKTLTVVVYDYAGNKETETIQLQK